MTACRCVDAVAARVHHLASRDPLHPRPFAQTAEGDIYDLKTEKEYEEIVNDRRQQNDFVVDDGKSCANRGRSFADPPAQTAGGRTRSACASYALTQ